MAGGKYNSVFTLQHYFMLNYIYLCRMKHSAFLERFNNFIPSCPLTHIVEVSYLTQVQKRKKERGKDREIKRGRGKDMSPRTSLAGWEPLNVPGWESSADAYKL